MSRRAIYGVTLAASIGISACSGGGDPKQGDAGPKPDQPSAPATVEAALRFRGLDVVDEKTVFVFGQTQGAGAQNLVLKTSDGGATWAVVLRIPEKDAQGGPASDLEGMDFADARNGVVMDEDGATYATSDGGGTWSAAFGGQMSRRFPAKASEDETVPELSGISAMNAREGWAVGIRQIDPAPGNKAASTITVPVVYHTSDGGTTWKSAKVDAGNGVASLRRVVFASHQAGWSVGGDAESADELAKDFVFRTKDGGTSWQRAKVETGLVITDVAFPDATNGYLVGSRDDESAATQIYGTKDGGATWQPVAKAPAALYAVRFADANLGWAVGAEGTILATSDGGATWSEVQIGDVATGGVSIARPKPAGASEDEQTAFFYGIALVEPNRGWVATDEGIFEYQRK